MKPEATSLSRSASFPKSNTDHFIHNLENVHKHFGPTPPERIWNADETGLTTAQNSSRIIAPEGVKQGRSIHRTHIPRDTPEKADIRRQ
jgi:hypothetical protein